MANEIDAEIRANIGTILATAQPAARVYPFNPLSHDLADWPGLFRTEAGGTHGHIIFRSQAAGGWKGSGGRDKRKFTYSIWSFYGFRPGKIGDNSDDEFQEILDDNYDAIKAKPRLDHEEVEEHSLLQYESITTINCGEETLHLATGKLEVMLCC